jgi:hypothetical protein
VHEKIACELVNQMYICIIPPAVHAELVEPAETISLGPRILFFVNISTRRGFHSSFCSLWPNLGKKESGQMNNVGYIRIMVGYMKKISYLPYPPKPHLIKQKGTI